MFATTVDSILASFNKTIAKLEALAEQKSAEAANHVIASTEAAKKADAAMVELGKARAAAGKIRALIG
jgi:hypothetical protein